MAELRNIDDVLIKSMNEQAGIDSVPVVQESQPANDPVVPEVPPEAAQDDSKVEAKSGEDPYLSAESAENTQKTTGNSQNEEKKSPIDEYGNPVEKSKTYSEEEVNAIIRQRLARGKHQEPPQQPPKIEQPTNDTEQGEDAWRQELENFVDATIDKRQKKQAEREWQEKELARQAEFEDKFTTGMNRYKDFREVVAGKPITDTMMMATRDLENPAAFIYAAAKLHPQELDRIARIQDNYAQAAEIGRLHERMIKAKAQAPNAHKPIEVPKGDMLQKNTAVPSIDERIHAYAKQKLR